MEPEAAIQEPEETTPDPEPATNLEGVDTGEAEEAQADPEPKQLPLEAWSEHQLAETGIELANHLHKLKNYEDVEGRRRRHYKENRDRMVDVIEGLRLRIREQRHALGINVHPSNFSEEEE